MSYLDFFSHEQFSDRLFIFNEGYSMVHRFTIGCIIGDEKVLVIDSGLGMTRDLRRQIESVVGVDKPIICACTHGHNDNVGSACLFDEAYCSLDDFDGQQDPFDPLKRYCDLIDYALESKIVMDYCKEHMIKDNRVEFLDIKDGHIFDLGGVQIEAIAIPGHSKGSMAFYNREENYCFTGDAINTDVRLLNLTSEGFREYANTLENFISRVDENVTLYPAHLPLPMPIDIAKNLVKICRDIADGMIVKDPPAESIFHAEKNNRNIRGHYYNNTCAVYNKALLDQANIKINYLDVCYYSHEKWSDRVYTVTINHCTVHRITLMVFVGDEKILVIDSGHGIDGKLREYIEDFAGHGKPVICACTHVGIDHAGGIGLFDEAYLHENDFKKLPLTRNRRLVDVQPFANYNKEFEEYCTEFMLEEVDPKTVKRINDGDIFHLGNLDVECVFTPGHAEGHMSFYCKTEKVAFTGDAMNVDTQLKGRSSSLKNGSFGRYAAMLENFFKRVEPDTLIFSGHLNRPHSMRVPRNIQAACIEINAHQTYGDPPAEVIQQHLTAFQNPHAKMHYHGNCCVVYDASK